VSIRSWAACATNTSSRPPMRDAIFADYRASGEFTPMRTRPGTLVTWLDNLSSIVGGPQQTPTRSALHASDTCDSGIAHRSLLGSSPTSIVAAITQHAIPGGCRSEGAGSARIVCSSARKAAADRCHCPCGRRGPDGVS
jgi:hypothetical protein